MQKDLKTGMLLGLIIAALAALWLSTRPSLSTEARMSPSPNTSVQTSTKQPPFAVNLPDVPASRTAGDNVKTKVETERSNKPDSAVNYYSREKIKTQRFHIVRKGETLYDIANQYYGSVHNWEKIRDANPDIIKDVNRLRPGAKLIIPE